MGQKQEKMENNSSSRNSLEDEAELNGLKIIKSYTGKDYGPLDFYDEEKTGSEIKYLSNIHSRNFQGGSYILATPKEGTTLNLYRFYGGRANSVGQYWTPEKRDGNLGTQIDLALHPTWKNTMEKINEIKIPHGLLIMYGKSSSQQGFGGGGFQVFIPLDYLRPFLEGNFRKAEIAQKNFIERYQKKTNEMSIAMLKEYQNLDKAVQIAKNGNLISSLPKEIKHFLKSNSTGKVKSSTKIKEGSYLVHREELHLPNGVKIPLTLSVRIEFSHETRSTRTSGNTIITEITRYYNKIFTWS